MVPNFKKHAYRRTTADLLVMIGSWPLLIVHDLKCSLEAITKDLLGWVLSWKPTNPMIYCRLLMQAIDALRANSSDLQVSTGVIVSTNISSSLIRSPGLTMVRPWLIELYFVSDRGTIKISIVE